MIGLQDLLLGSPPSALDDEARDLVQRMRRETERVHRVMRDLLDFARAGQQPAHDGDARAHLGDVLQEVLALLRPQRAFRGVELRPELAPSLPPIAIDGSRLGQVLLNLLLNAADALQSGGAVEAKVIRITGQLEPAADASDDGKQLRVDVVDNGPGVPEAIRARLFEPFVTTKAAGHGTGLGLAVCRNLLEACNGRIEWTPSDIGAHFTLHLPVARAEATEEPRGGAVDADPFSPMASCE